MPPTHSKTATRLIQDGQWMPAKINWGARHVVFRKIDVPAFRKVPFHDGRHDFMDNPAETISFDTFVALAPKLTRPQPDRFLLHPSFCGSTFLARLLSHDKQTACYREPQVLIELSNGQNDPLAPALNAAILEQFRHAPEDGMTAFVKPSNWANGYLLQANALHEARGVIIRIDLKAFLIANLRGGNERLKYSLNLLNHLMTFAPEKSPLVQEAQTLLARSPMRATLRLIAILHAIQAESFDKALARPKSRMMQIPHTDISSRPIETTLTVSNWLELGLSKADITHQFTEYTGQHAKSLLPQSFSKQKEIDANTALMTQFGRDIMNTLEWAEGTFRMTGTH